MKNKENTLSPTNVYNYQNIPPNSSIKQSKSNFIIYNESRKHTNNRISNKNKDSSKGLISFDLNDKKKIKKSEEIVSKLVQKISNKNLIINKEKGDNNIIVSDPTKRGGLKSGSNKRNNKSKVRLSCQISSDIKKNLMINPDYKNGTDDKFIFKKKIKENSLDINSFEQSDYTFENKTNNFTIPNFEQKDINNPKKKSLLGTQSKIINQKNKLIQKNIYKYEKK